MFACCVWNDNWKLRVYLSVELTIAENRQFISKVDNLTGSIGIYNYGLLILIAGEML